MPNLTHFTSGSRYPALLLLLLPFLITACFNPEPEDYGLALEAVDVVCVEATFRVTASGVPETWTCGLYRDDSLVVTETLSGQSGYIRDTGLLPAADYTYHITYMKEGRDKDRSDPIAVTTLDTTSHDFTWTVETLGDAGSYFNDVAIVDENNIWVVGYIKKGDSIYNAAHWDGEKWEMIRVMFAVYYSEDPTFIDNVQINSLYYINNSNSLFFTCLGALTIYEDLRSWKYIELNPMQGVPGNSIWGSSSDNVWFAGNNGTLVHYDGSRFRRVESGTGVDLKDMDGTPDGKHVFVAGVMKMGDWAGYSVFLHIEEGIPKIKYTSTPYSGDPENGNFGAIHALTVTDSRVYTNPLAVDMLVYEIIPDIYHYYPVKSTVLRTDYYAAGLQICGKRNQDILFISQESVVVHYNGSSLRIMMDLLQLYGNNMLWVRRARYTDNLAVIVGLFDSGIPGGIIVKGVHHE
jgi:hypothetical protein